jgi:hypothetical protein
MRNRPLGIALALAVALCIASTLCAQSKKPEAKTAAAPAQDKTSFDPHDLSGVWMQDHPRPMTADERYWVYKFTLEEPPLSEWGANQFASTKTSFGPHATPLAETNDPVYHTCAPLGFPRIFLYPLPFQIVQTPTEVIMLFEYDWLRHHIYADGRKHDQALGPLWMGDAIGHWEGDTFVADTTNFNDKTWLDRMGHPHSDALHVVERIRRTDFDHLVDDMTIDDPKAYTKTWVAHQIFVLQPKWTVAESFCEDEQSFEGIDESGAEPSKK